MIREASLTDIPALLELFYNYYKEGNMKWAEWSDGKTRQSILHGITDEEKLLLVAEKSDKIVGALYGELVYPAFSYTPVFDARILYVLPENRGGTLGVQLIKKAKQMNKEAGVPAINIGVTSEIHTERTAKLYEKLGFYRVGYEYRTEV